PTDGVIDQRTECYLAGGEPRFWRHEAGGYNDDHEWTSTTANAKPSNFARWLLRSTRATTYHIEANVQGGAATAASYQIFHGGQTDTVTIDQSTADGFVVLGDFDLTGDGTEYVQLGDNTGMSGQKLVVDALRVTALDSGSMGDDDDDDGGGGGGSDGGCATGGGASPWFVLLALGLIVRRSR
ncbi:MAG TPA: hypothetical protein VGM39_01920, partial [Kofleriaceae bacterium]